MQVNFSKFKFFIMRMEKVLVVLSCLFKLHGFLGGDPFQKFWTSSSSSFIFKV